MQYGIRIEMAGITETQYDSMHAQLAAVGAEAGQVLLLTSLVQLRTLVRVRGVGDESRLRAIHAQSCALMSAGGPTPRRCCGRARRSQPQGERTHETLAPQPGSVRPWLIRGLLNKRWHSQYRSNQGQWTPRLFRSLLPVFGAVGVLVLAGRRGRRAGT